MTDRSGKPRQYPATRTALWRSSLAALMLLPLQAAAFFGAIPTFDINSFEQLRRTIEQVAIAKQQLAQAQSQLLALTQSSGYGELLSHPALKEQLRAALPAQAQALLGYHAPAHPQLTRDVATLVSAIKAPVHFRQDRIALNEQRLNIEATTKVVAQQTYNAMTQRLHIIDGLQSRINKTRNPKEIAELQARIGIEQANIQTDQTRIQLLQQQLQAERALLEARAEQVYAGWFGTRPRP